MTARVLLALPLLGLAALDCLHRNYAVAVVVSSFTVVVALASSSPTTGSRLRGTRFSPHE